MHVRLFTTLNAFSCAFNTFFVVRVCRSISLDHGVRGQQRPVQLRVVVRLHLDDATLGVVPLLALDLPLQYIFLYRCIVFDYGLTARYFVGKVLEIHILFDRLQLSSAHQAHNHQSAVWRSSTPRAAFSTCRS